MVDQNIVMTDEEAEKLGIYTIKQTSLLSTTLTFSCGISIDCATGEVTIPSNLNLTEAALEFWNAVSRVAKPPGFV